MAILQKIATVFVPMRTKREKVMALHLKTAITMLRRMDEKDPQLAEEVFVAGMEEVGRDLAREMKAELKLGSRFADVVDAWKIACRISEMKVAITSGTDGVAFEHIGCPLWEAAGRTDRLCNTLCVPMVQAMTNTVMPGARTELTRPVTKERACIKTVRPPAEPS